MHTSATRQNNAGAFIAIIETLFLFFMGLLSSKISEVLQIHPTTLLVFTGVSLLVLGVVSYVRGHSANAQPTPALKTETANLKLVPRTMVGVFPFGIIAGFIIGSAIPSVGLTTSAISGPSWYAALFGVDGVGMHSYEFIGVFIAIVFCLLFAILIDGHLAAALLVGYAISFPTAILVIRSAENMVMVTYIAYIVGLGMVGFVLMVAEPVFRWLRKIVTEARI